MTYVQVLDFKNMGSPTKRVWNNGIPVDITPEMAIYWIKISDGKNVRSLNQKQVDAIVADLMSGNHTTRTIRFHKDGWCADGQHFLNAIIQSGITARKIFVELGYSDEEISKIDTGIVRSFSVTSAIAGESVTGVDAALAIVLEDGFDAIDKKYSHTQKRYLIHKYKEEVEFIRNNLKARIKPVAMKKAIIDVYNLIKSDPEKVSRLIQFMHVYSSSDISGGSSDQAAINLVKALARVPTAQRSTRYEVYRLTATAINNFMEKKKAKKLYMTKKQKEVLKHGL
jgi:hypothetical protein